MKEKSEKNGDLEFEFRNSGFSEVILRSEIVKSISPQVDNMLRRFTKVTEKDNCYEFLRKLAKIRAYVAMRESLQESAIYIREIESECENQGVKIDEMFKRIFSKYSEIGVHPLEAELSARGSSSVKYLTRMIIDNVVFSNLSDLKARILHMLDDVKESSILVDIGCGPGEYITEILAKKIKDLFVVGIDINLDAIQTSKRRTLKHKNVSYILADAHHLPLKNESIDYSLCVWTIGLLESPKKYVKEIYRILTEGGKAVVTVPYIYKYLDHPGYREHPRHVDKPKYRNLPRDIKNVGLKCGFHIEDKARWIYQQKIIWIYEQMDEILIKFAK